MFEFRHKSWYEQDTFDLLDKRGVTLCVHDMGEKAPPRLVTGEMLYLRLHGPGGYDGDYPDRTLEQWADWVKGQMDRVRTVYTYFNNDVGGRAIHNAKTFKEMMGVA